jgi:hypothetical protein
MTPDAIADLAQRFAREVLDPLKHAFVGKDEIIDLMGVSLAARPASRVTPSITCSRASPSRMNSSAPSTSADFAKAIS